MIKTAAALCAGVGGLEQALATFGIETTWYCETDPDAALVLEKRLEGVPNLGDIRDRATWRTAPVPGILTAGFPCQPISQAGKQRGRADDRYLWPNVRDAVADLMPATVFLENVQNLASIHQGGVLAEVLGDLRTLGYAARWTILGACAVELSHHRHRWFLRADRVDSGNVPTAVRIPATCGAPPRRHKLLPTPTASEKSGAGHSSAHGMNLRTAVSLLPELPANKGSAVTADLIGDRFRQYAWAVQRQVTNHGVLPPEPMEPNTRGGRRMAAPFPEWMMAYPAGWVTDLLDRVPALRCIGNGASPIQTAAAWRLLKPTDPLAHCVFCGRPTGGPLNGCSEPNCQRREIEMEAAFKRSEDR